MMSALSHMMRIVLHVTICVEKLILSIAFSLQKISMNASV